MIYGVSSTCYSPDTQKTAGKLERERGGGGGEEEEEEEEQEEEENPSTFARKTTSMN